MTQVSDAHQTGDADPLHLEEGTCYLVKGRTAEAGYRYARWQAEEGLSVLCVSRLHPDRVRTRYGLGQVTRWWISTCPGDDNFDPTAIGTLASAIQGFIGVHLEGCLVLLDGLEYIGVNVGFDKTLLFLEHLNEFVMPRRATLLVPLSPECFEPVQMAMLERFTEAIDEADLRDALDLHDANRDPMN